MALKQDLMTWKATVVRIEDVGFSSNDLFVNRQFGEFGEAALMTVVVQSAKKDNVLAHMYDILQVGEPGVGLICEDKPIGQMKTYF